MDAEQLKKRTKDFSHRCVKLGLSLPKTPLARHVQGNCCEVQRPFPPTTGRLAWPTQRRLLRQKSASV